MAFFPREGYRFLLLHVILTASAYFLLLRFVPQLGRFVWLAAPSASGFVITMLDKLSAQVRVRRIPETALHAIALLGGSLGVFAGMQLMRHKTRKVSFQFTLTAVFLIQLAILYFLMK
ncbi:DUF1294 domain-containing protein [Patescibacteria group bacterium]|nr:MAG: DUF1294 domain-containing protein [Patescibacteria group bacterium]